MIDRIIRPMGVGITNPYLVKLNDQKNYVVKFPGNPEGTKALFNEYFCAELSKLFHLPVPNYKLIELSNIEDYGYILNDIKLINGTAFGSEYLENASPVPDYLILTKISNKEAVIKTLIFDIIIGNNDRNPGNFLVNLKNKSFVVIDHSHVFINGTVWSEYSLKEEIDKTIDIDCMNKRTFDFSIQILNDSIVRKNIIEYVEKIKSIKKEELEKIISSVPEDWGISDNEKKAVIDFIMNRINRINEICSLLSIEGGE